MNMEQQNLELRIQNLEHTSSVRALSSELRAQRGFTLIETMVAISLLTVAIVAPMLLTVQSLKSAYYSRDQVTAFHLAQEALETVHAKRDSNILKIAAGQAVNIFEGLPSFSGAAFKIEGSTGAMSSCGGPCPPLQTDGTLYNYTGGTNTNFTRTVTACYVHPSPSALCDGTPQDEVRVSVTVSWQTGSYQQRSISISEDLYGWAVSGSAT